MPADRPIPSLRSFCVGILLTPSGGDLFADAHKRASALAEFVPVCGRPIPFYQLVQELLGSWGHTFVEQYIRGNGMFSIINRSFIGADMTLAAPPSIQGAKLENPEWCKAHMQAALDIVRAVKPLYLSLGNEVNRGYERYGASDGDPMDSGTTSLYTMKCMTAPKNHCHKPWRFASLRGNSVRELKSQPWVIKMFNRDRLDMLIFTSYLYAVKGMEARRHTQRLLC